MSKLTTREGSRVVRERTPFDTACFGGSMMLIFATRYWHITLCMLTACFAPTSLAKDNSVRSALLLDVPTVRVHQSTSGDDASADQVVLITDRESSVAADCVRQAQAELPAESVPKPAPNIPAPAGMGILNRPLDSITLSDALGPQALAASRQVPDPVVIPNRAEEIFGEWRQPQVFFTEVGVCCAASDFSWAAPAVYHRPLYFEQPNLERYGHYVTCCDCPADLLQSGVSAAHFFATVPLLPYKIGVHSCCERQYVLGSYRPGSCNPHQLTKPQLSCRGLTYQTLATSGIVFVVP